MEIEKPGSARPWHEIVREALKRERCPPRDLCAGQRALAADRGLHAETTSQRSAAAREEEAVGIATGAWMGGMLGVVLMQTSGFATLPNVLASLAVPYQIPLLMIISERGTLGEFNLGQAMVCRTMRPALNPWASSTTRSDGWTRSRSSSTGPSGRPSPPRRRRR